MGREERRATIINATIPLLVEHGALVTTRQIAQAAGVAEGTLFRVFADKDEILRDTVLAAVDPLPTVAALRAIPADLPLDQTVRLMCTVMIERFELVTKIFGTAHRVLGGHKMANAAHRDHLGAPGDHHTAPAPPGPHAMFGMVTSAIADQLQPHANVLRIEPRVAARILYCLILADCLPMPASGERLTIEHIVDVVLHGIAGDTG